MSDILAAILYSEGAWCGVCEYEGWDACPECRQTCQSYARAIEAAGFAPIRETADRVGGRYARLHQLLRDELQAQAWDAGAVAGWKQSGEGWNSEYPDESTGECSVDLTSNPYRT